MIEMRGNKSMVAFVNRQTETMLINSAFEALHNPDKDNLLRTPILGFCGIEGIGKTALLDYIEEQCKKQQIRYIIIDASQSARHFSREIVRQVTERYNIWPSSLDETEDLFQQSLSATRALLEQGAAVMIVDSVNVADGELLERIADTLRHVIHENKLFVAIASKRGVLFDSELSRKLTSLQLKPIDPESCEHYLDIINPALKPETKRHILAWTRGYPLAMEVMTRAITEQKLDPAQPPDQKVLKDLIVERVIDEKVFAKLTPSERSKYKEALSILSIPRNFNVPIMQKTIENFIPEFKRENRLAYMRLPSIIKNDTGVLIWNIFKNGFTIDVPIRNIFLLKIRIEQPERYLALHQFFAELNKRLAGEVVGSYHLRYLCEYLYHSAHVKNEQKFSEILKQTLREIEKDDFDSFDAFESFELYFEEILQDNEFREALGEGAATAYSLIYGHLVEINRRGARISSGEEHFHHLRSVFIYIVKDLGVEDVSAAWVPAIREMIAEEPGGYTSQFLEELLDSKRLEDELGNNFAVLARLIPEIALEDKG
jgi:hypothetical protein